MPALRTTIGAGLMLGLAAPPLLAQSTFNTALSQPEANSLLYGTCDRERGRAQSAAANQRPPLDWGDMMAQANRVLLANVDTAQLNRMLDKTSSQNQDIGEFQYCLIINKINLAEAHEKRAKR